MTTNDIDAIRKLTDAADPGPWTVEHNGKGNAWVNLPAFRHAWGMHGFPDEAAFVAAAVTIVPALCDEIKQLRAEREHMELHPTGTVEWLKNRVNELTAELAAERARTQETHQ